MSTLLRIDSSPLSGGASFSRHLTTEFVSQWLRTHPEGKVITRDLITTPLSPINAELIAAIYVPPDSRTDRQREILTLSNELIAELKGADEYVFGVSMHNFSIPAVLKLWLDQIVRLGETFAYENGAPAGLLTGKKAYFLVASGAVYDPGTPLSALNFVEPYLRALFGFLGVTDVTFINAGGTTKVQYGVDRSVILQPAVASIQAQFQAV